MPANQSLLGVRCSGVVRGFKSTPLRFCRLFLYALSVGYNWLHCYQTPHACATADLPLMQHIVHFLCLCRTWPAPSVRRLSVFDRWAGPAIYCCFFFYICRCRLLARAFGAKPFWALTLGFLLLVSPSRLFVATGREELTQHHQHLQIFDLRVDRPSGLVLLALPSWPMSRSPSMRCPTRAAMPQISTRPVLVRRPRLGTMARPAIQARTPFNRSQWTLTILAAP